MSASNGRPTPISSRAEVGSKEARRAAALVLEALGGLRSASEAAEALGCPLPRYYVLERRAIQGMIRALERRPRGRQRTLKSELERAQREVERLEREVLRYQALHRAAQRAIGVPREDAPAPTGKPKTTRLRRKKSRAEKVLPRLVGEESGKDAPAQHPASDALPTASEEV